MIYLVRHGQTALNSQGRVQGRLDSALSDLGVAQARAVGAKLAALKAEDPGEWVIETSPLGRTRATAKIIADAMGLTEIAVEPRLVEADYGLLEGLTRPEINARWPHLAAIDIGMFGVAPEGEPLAALDARARAWLDSVDPKDGRRRVAIAHASIGRAIRGAYTGLAFEDYRRLETPQDAFHRLHEGRIERIDCAPLPSQPAAR